MFYLTKWADVNGLFKTNRLNLEHICLILIQFGLGHFKNLIKDSQIWLQTIDNDSKTISICDQIGGFGRLFIQFMRFLTSKNFCNIQSMNFENLNFNIKSFFQQNEWDLIYKVGFF